MNGINTTKEQSPQPDETWLEAICSLLPGQGMAKRSSSDITSISNLLVIVERETESFQTFC
jgi:hypothetical protein